MCSLLKYNIVGGQNQPRPLSDPLMQTEEPDQTLWLKSWTAVFALVAVALLALAIFVGAIYRRGWTTSSETVKAITCTVLRKVKCSQRRCQTSSSKHCTLRVKNDDFPELSKVYAREPKAGEQVDVHYDVARQQHTATLDRFGPMTRYSTVGMLVVLSLLSTGVACRLFPYRTKLEP